MSWADEREELMRQRRSAIARMRRFEAAALASKDFDEAVDLAKQAVMAADEADDLADAIEVGDRQVRETRDAMLQRIDEALE